MDERFTSIDIRDDGFLQVTLKSEDDFDDYIYQQMQKDGGCLPCVRDHHNPCILFYDTKGYVTLRAYMKSYTFEQRESCAFLMQVLERMIAVNTSKPICMNLDFIFVSYDGGMLRFLVIPVAMEQWVFQRMETSAFLSQIISEIRISQGYEAIGYLAYMQRFEEITLPMLLQGLHDVYEQGKHKQTFFEKLLHLHEEQPFVMKQIPLPKAYPQFEATPQVKEDASPYVQHDIQQETVVLFHRESVAKLLAIADGSEIALLQEHFTIGRAKDNDLCIEKATVSFHHACIHRDDFILEDLSSSNGTYVNEQCITSVTLHDRDIIRFANESYRILL